ncbi:hypothetical protein ACIBXA_20000 [Micromonospora echinaurantiaca]|uniref:LppU/SCO3897 family protein n=1 Tax=Micromonospora TaxID=1873 RepID=UPI000D6F695B|nr:hypothetical protein DLJ47_03635 [Micromonospora sp. S4605]
MIIGLVVVLVLCPCLGLAGWAVYQAAEDDDPSPSPSVSASASAEPTAEPSPDESSAEPSPTSDDDDYAKGDCVVNDGTDDDAELRKVPCGPNTYEVLLRLPATTDADQCKTRAPRSTAHYVHDNSVDLFDYVLCLRKR